MRLKELRKNRGISQEDVAVALGITVRAYQNYEYEQREPNIEMIIKLAEFYGVTTDYLLGRNQNELTTIDKLAGEFNMSALEKEILDGYVNLPQNRRGDLMEFLQKAVQKVMKESSEEHTVTVQYAARSPDSQGTGTRELTEEQIRALMNAKNHASDLD